MAAHKDILGDLRLVPSSVEGLVGEDGKVCFHLVIIPGGVFQNNYLFGFARIDEELGRFKVGRWVWVGRSVCKYVGR